MMANRGGIRSIRTIDAVVAHAALSRYCGCFMFARLGSFVARHPLPIVLGWLLFVVTLRWIAPDWSDVAHDGDLAHLPAEMTSVAGEKLLQDAFPQELARSQIVVVLSRTDGELRDDDIYVGYDIARRLKNLHVEAALAQALKSESGNPGEARWLEDALSASADAIEFDEMLSEEVAEQIGNQPAPIPSIYRNRAGVLRMQGEADEAEEMEAFAKDLESSMKPNEQSNGDNEAFNQPLPLVDVWTWREPVLGKKLISEDQRCRLIVLQLSNELLAVSNIAVLEQIERELEHTRAFARQLGIQGMQLNISGSAAIGADLLRSSRAMIRHTELFSAVLVLLILIVVYRSPMLIFVPLVSIIAALLTSTSLVACLTQLDWLDVKVFTTTRIFVTVILFGAGTDYCLFVIARFREELTLGAESGAALRKTLVGVGEALAASSLTTVVGLSMMMFADFGKYRHSGPVIGFCLIVTFAVCMTLTPALLRLAGRAVFWPWPPERNDGAARSASWWDSAAQVILKRPRTTLFGSLILMAPFAVAGMTQGDVTYDLLKSLSPRCPSHQGAAAMERHFDVGESSPVTILVHRPRGELLEESSVEPIRRLAEHLYLQDAGGGVAQVRSIIDPLGDFAPGEPVPLLGSRAWRMRMARPHRRTEARFLAQADKHIGRVGRFELILENDPFSYEAIQTVEGIEKRLSELTADPDSFWSQATFYITGTTSGIRDLRRVTRSDNIRIEILVVLGVLAVLLLILRRPFVCSYLIVSVLFSYFVTLGGTHWFFQFLYGDSFVGLDWRTPLFLFVILVAVGQDYNVYLATRVFEEQARLGASEGLRRAIVRTGGIITSCGVIMAGAFASMTSSAWAEGLASYAPTLDRFVADTGAIRGITELGFALTVGVLLDTLVVRPILVPAFFAMQIRNRSGAD